MLIESRVLIEDIIDRLESLADILRSETSGQASSHRALDPQEERTRKEIGLSIRVLLPKLRSLRGRRDVPDVARGRVCENCED